ncbi:TetR/AcrR family transcriptional regulator [Williamsia sterculiae]|uniref:Transcriptional regulator, TetR family n=1 Tax=Williamsia sterculiae TaxID=1344003 RepID=A0A1N7H6I0_9NOCA|nr:TetR/AcrR family transcriptional regulator [Williamsia sterculiae]SIS20484.1 transcriptional regulator, TetR family [Williamsia sterculiae]
MTVTRPTRRRGAELDAAIRDAVLAELAAHGYLGLTFEGVAAAAATSKAVLYRRWSSRADMVVAAMAHGNGPFPDRAPDTGSLRSDLIATLQSFRSVLGDHARSTLLGVLADVDPDSTEQLRQMLFEKSSEILAPLIARARERGELGPAPIPPRVAALPIDLFRHENLLRGRLDDHDAAEIVDQCLIPLYRVHSELP